MSILSLEDYNGKRLIVNGIDLTQKYNMLLLDGYTLTPPNQKTYMIDIPGGNGKIDLTDSLFGDSVFDNRSQTFKFAIIGTEDFERNKTEISNLLHGREFDYVLTWDPDYTYHGRFSVNSYTHSVYTLGMVGVIEISIDAKPFKYKEVQHVEINAVGGTNLPIKSGRLRVRPLITVNGSIKLIYENKEVELKSGTWQINDLMLHMGDNNLYFNSFDIKNIYWKYFIDTPVTWGQLGTKPIFEWYKSLGVGTIAFKPWNSLPEGTIWSDLAGQTWDSFMYINEDAAYAEPIYLDYEWGDL